MDGTKIEANAIKFTFVWRKSIERYSSNLIEKSNAMYDELLEKEIIRSIEREKEQELSVEENGTFSTEDIRKIACVYLFMINASIFIYLMLVLSQPHEYLILLQYLLSI